MVNIEEETKDIDYWVKEDYEIYETIRKSGMHAVGAMEAMTSFNHDDLKVIKKFVECYNHYFQ